MEFADRVWRAHARSCIAADGRPGHRDNRKKSILLERAPSDVKKDGAKDVKVTPDQRPNRTARDRRAENLTRTGEESKAKREVKGAHPTHHLDTSRGAVAAARLPSSTRPPGRLIATQAERLKDGPKQGTSIAAGTWLRSSRSHASTKHSRGRPSSSHPPRVSAHQGLPDDRWVRLIPRTRPDSR